MERPPGGGIGRTLRRWLAGGLLLAATPLLAGRPARALEELELRLPLLDTSIVVRLDELGDEDTLWSGDSDLAELDRASDGAIGRQVLQLFHHPVPLPAGVSGGLEGSVGSPLLHQALLATTALVRIDGISTDLSGEALSGALRLSEREGSVTLLSLLRALPGGRASVDLGRAVFVLERLKRQQRPAQELLLRQPVASVDPVLNRPGAYTVQRRQLRLPVSHRKHPLHSVVLLPAAVSPRGLVFISHGLWDAPVNFEGWGRHLASHGYAVLLPEHPGSDRSQQAAMLSGSIPPPDPEELGLRPLDISALLDALDEDALALGPIPSERVVVLGHSWGAITALQLAGLKPSDGRLERRCGDLNDPEANVSWVLQCSFLRSANRADVAEPRVIGAAAVSPPMRLLFDDGASRDMNGRALVVSGSKDWVVPFAPEALHPFQGQPVDRGHQLVLADGGTHFNLRPGPRGEGAVLRGLMLTWVQQVFAAGERARPSPGASRLLPAGGWGDPGRTLVEATPPVRGAS
ncbi:MAG: alpha/beta fold hydrolase [Synechococcaceae cyanobacterium]|nr:alpha/beta fold hydrolase [Synechococcaceae cyanobacterium]